MKMDADEAKGEKHAQSKYSSTDERYALGNPTAMLALTFQAAKVKESNAKLKNRPEQGGNKDVNNGLHPHIQDHTHPRGPNERQGMCCA